MLHAYIHTAQEKTKLSPIQSHSGRERGEEEDPSDLRIKNDRTHSRDFPPKFSLPLSAASRGGTS